MKQSILDDIDLFLPKYLSADSTRTLLDELKAFPLDGTKATIYTSVLGSVDYLLQGDGIANVEYLNFPDTTIRKIPVILFSNTCDMSLENERINSAHILYAPLVNFEKYARMVWSKFPDVAEQHLKSLRSQRISQALFLPAGGKLEYDAIVFFDQMISLPLSSENVKAMVANRLFTLSNFGFYLFLLKTSIHFTRIQEKVDRK